MARAAPLRRRGNAPGDAGEPRDWNAEAIEESGANWGKVGGPFEGAPLLLSHTTGARSGPEWVNPMMDLDLDLGESRYVFASKASADDHPDRYRNLVERPAVTVEVGTEAYEATAIPATGAHRDRIHAEQARRYRGLADCQARTSRVTPVVELRRT